jgi:hypothetical protein
MPVSFVEKEVKSDQKVVDKVNIVKADTFDEFISYIADNVVTPKGDTEKAKAFVFERAQAQYNTDLMNAARAAATGEPTKAQLQAQAMQEFSQLTPDEMKSIAGDPTRFQQWQAEKMAAILAKFKEDRAAKQAAAQPEEAAAT